MSRRGDPGFDAAMRRIDGWVRAWGAELLAVARGSTRSEADAQDAVARSWEVVLARWDRLPAEEHARGWLVRIVLNVARAEGRKEKRRRELREENRDRIEPRSDARQPDLQVRLLADAVVREISSLPELQREVVALRILNGMSTREVAHAIDRTEGTVKTSLFRGLRTLRDALGADFQEALASVTAREGESTS